jgi:general secretion pathway protein K
MRDDRRAPRTAPRVAGDAACGTDDGYVTLSVLLISGFLAVIVLGLMVAPRPTLGRSVLAMTALEVEMLLDSGLHLSAYRLFAPAEEITGLDETVALENGRVSVTAVAETSRIDLNATDAILLMGLFDTVGARSMSAARFAAEIVTLREAARERGEPAFPSVGAMAALPGLAPADFDLLAPHLTVYGSGLIDAWTASRTVLLAVPDLAPGDIDRLISLRRKSDTASQAALETLAADYAAYLTLSPERRFRVTIDAWSDNGMAGRAQAIIEEGEGERPFRTLLWARETLASVGRGRAPR